MYKWIALFSQTGSEIVEIMKRTNRIPHLIVTNNLDNTYSPELYKLNIPILLGKHKVLMDYLRTQNDWKVIITLHGYLRILPEDICLNFSIYNGHPAPIHLYPELIGKDKQEDLFTYKDKYAKIGSVIHKVTADLDRGEIIISEDQDNDVTSIEDSYIKARELSLKTWIYFFEKYQVQI